MPISSPSDLLLNVELSTDIATQDELDSLATSIVGTPEDSEDEMTLNGLKKKDEILSERIGTVEEQASEALAAANVANENANTALEGISTLSGRVSGLEERVQQVEENVQTLETGVQTAMTNAEAAATTAAGADTKATAAATAVAALDGKVATLEQNDAEQDGRLDTIEGQIPNLALKTDIHDGTLQVTVNGAGGFTFTANQAGNTSYDIVVPSTDDFVAKSDFDDLSGRVNTAEGDIDQLQSDVQDLGDRVTDVEGNVEQALADADSAYRLAESAETEAETAGSVAGEAMTKANSVENIAYDAKELAEGAQSAADVAQATADGAATSAITNAGSIEQIYSQINDIVNGYYRYSYNRTPEGQHSQYGWYDFYIGSGECTDLYGNHYFPDGNEYEGGVLYSSDRAQILIGYTSENNVGIWYRTCSENDEHGQRIINPWTILDTMKSPLPMYSPYQNLGEWLVTVDSILGSFPNTGDIICQDGDDGSLYKGGNSSNLLQEPPRIQSHQLALVDSIAREYNGGSYDSGDYITYRGYLYRCLSATSLPPSHSEATAYWEEVSVTDEISDNLSALSSELGNIAAILDNINGVNL